VNAPRRAAALIIGNELLTGKTADANLVILARTLRLLGVALERVVIIPDQSATIADEVRALAHSHDLVFTSGGLGPTHDDLTVAAVARAFDVPTVVPEELRAMLERHCGEQITEGHLRMARVPEGARLLRAPESSWPTVVMRNVWMLPGVPEIFARKMAVLQSELGGGLPFVSLRIRTQLDECTLKPWLDQVVAAHADVEIGSYPQAQAPDYCTDITFDALDRERAARARDALLALLPAGAIVGEPEAT
jgi:molybdenum cofactor synthesis domain-containing protein